MRLVSDGPLIEPVSVFIVRATIGRTKASTIFVGSTALFPVNSNSGHVEPLKGLDREMRNE
jgi:hypothetical protein